MAVIRNISIDQGSTYQAELVVFDDNGQPLNISGFNARATFKRNFSSSTSYDMNPIINDGPSEGDAGVVHFYITDEDTAVFPTGRFVYDLIIENPTPGNDPEGNAIATPVILRVMEGIVTVNPGVTS